MAIRLPNNVGISFYSIVDSMGELPEEEIAATSIRLADELVKQLKRK